MNREGLSANKAAFVTAVRMTVSCRLPFGKLLGGRLPELITFIPLASYLWSLKTCLVEKKEGKNLTRAAITSRTLSEADVRSQPREPANLRVF